MIQPLLLLLLAAIASPLPAPRQDARLSQSLEAAEELPVDAIWETARDLFESPLVDREALLRALDQRLADGAGLGPGARLLLVASRLQGPEPDLVLLAAELGSLMDSEREDLARGASELLGKRSFESLAGEPKQRVLESLLTRARDATRAPELRLTAAFALYSIGAGKDRRAARREMLAFLDSQDVELRTLGALTLAQAGDVETGRAELERLAGLPGTQGELAAALLKQEDIRRFYDRKLANQDNQFKQRQRSEQTGEFPEVDRVGLVLQRVEQVHLEGDKRSRAELIEAALEGLLRSLDAQSSYMSSDDYARFLSTAAEVEHTAIGTWLRVDPFDGLLTVTRVLPSSPAYRAGLEPNDKIVRIDSWSTLSRPLDDCVTRLRGESGQSVKLYVWRRGMRSEKLDRPDAEMAIEVAFEEQPTPALRSVLLPEEIGLIEIASLDPETPAALEATLRKLQLAGARALVLDLRNSSGRDLDSAAGVCELFLGPDLLLVSVESRFDESHRLFSERPAQLAAEVPLAVIVNRFTCSAGEVAAAALQDHGRARVYGERSPGLGSSQLPIRIPGETDDLYQDDNGNGRYDPWETITEDWNDDGSFDYAPRVFLTTARFRSPSGRSIHPEYDDEGALTNEGGVEPDVPIDVFRWEPWQQEEVTRIRAEQRISTWVEELLQAQPRELRPLAENDGGQPTAYPGFEELHAELETPLTADDVHRLLRASLRRRLREGSQEPLPLADWQSDRQLQKALAGLLEERGESYMDVELFALVFDLEQATRAAGNLIAAAIPSLGREAVNEAVRHLEEALDNDGQLSSEDLNHIENILTRALEAR